MMSYDVIFDDLANVSYVDISRMSFVMETT